MTVCGRPLSPLQHASEIAKHIIIPPTIMYTRNSAISMPIASPRVLQASTSSEDTPSSGSSFFQLLPTPHQIMMKMNASMYRNTPTSYKKIL